MHKENLENTKNIYLYFNDEQSEPGIKIVQGINCNYIY